MEIDTWFDRKELGSFRRDAFLRFYSKRMTEKNTAFCSEDETNLWDPDNADVANNAFASVTAKTNCVESFITWLLLFTKCINNSVSWAPTDVINRLFKRCNAFRNKDTPGLTLVQRLFLLLLHPSWPMNLTPIEKQIPRFHVPLKQTMQITQITCHRQHDDGNPFTRLSWQMKQSWARDQQPPWQQVR